MTRRLVVTYLSITAFALAALGVPLGITFAHRERDRLAIEIERDAGSVASLAEDALQDNRPVPVAAALAQYHRRTGGRIVVVDANGTLVADSDDPAARRESYASRPGIAAALRGEQSAGRAGDLLYVAIPVASGGVIHGAVRASYPTGTRDRRVRDMWWTLVGLCGAVLAVVAVVGWVLARSVNRPVHAIEAAVARVAEGDLAARAPVVGGIPELRELARTFNSTAARLDELVSSQRRFVADVAHQLRTPLTALRLRLENLADDDGEPALHEVERLTRIVDGLLTLARAEATPPTSVIDVAAVAVARVDAWRDLAAEQEVTLIAPAAAGTWATGASDALDQILDNLLANALAVAPAGSTVSISVRRTQGNVELHVVDAGPGLDPDARERAFDRFWRGDLSVPGTGLGLAVVRQLARTAGGDARLDVGPSGGIDAVVTFPAAEPLPSPNPDHVRV